MILPEKHDNNYLFTYKFIKFYGNDVNNDLIKLNFDDIINNFIDKSKNLDKSLLMIPVDNNLKTLTLYLNQYNKNNPYLILRNIKNDVKSYTITVNKNDYLSKPDKLIKIMDTLIKHDTMILNNNFTLFKDISNYANFIDKYDSISDKYK